jgi:hypothetical protein
VAPDHADVSVLGGMGEFSVPTPLARNLRFNARLYMTGTTRIINYTPTKAFLSGGKPGACYRVNPRTGRKR